MTANAIEERERSFIGYYNHQDMPLAISDQGRPHEIIAGAPVTNQDGTLVAFNTTLEELANSGLLRRIPRDHPTFKNHDKLIKQRANVTLSNAKEEGKKPTGAPAPKKEDDDLVTVVSSGNGGGNDTSQLPDGAKWTDDRGRTEILYEGKYFPGVSALKAFIKSNQ